MVAVVDDVVHHVVAVRRGDELKKFRENDALHRGFPQSLLARENPREILQFAYRDR